MHDYFYFIFHVPFPHAEKWNYRHRAFVLSLAVVAASVGGGGGVEIGSRWRLWPCFLLACAVSVGALFWLFWASLAACRECSTGAAGCSRVQQRTALGWLVLVADGKDRCWFDGTDTAKVLSAPSTCLPSHPCPGSIFDSLKRRDADGIN